ncbi:hypothetical protein SAMN05216464_106119 [Mucilaginibacter pineti]|uniref:Uncharacterized protein n=1 Tax=Mucilaginibacter pineti TaxID=1391627 RepID=A0A1G7CVJ6_9SPHI|nr:hypothetical protein [Mucilaginibacter pineti]SDE43348.1 hypothetical protein SAMN05216464_106119 [Mucilaginibacter pineti]
MHLLNETASAINQKKESAILELTAAPFLLGNYTVIFYFTNDEHYIGTVEFNRKNGKMVKGTFQVYIDNEEVYAALYSTNMVKLIDKPYPEFLNMLKILTLAKK